MTDNVVKYRITTAEIAISRSKIQEAITMNNPKSINKSAINCQTEYKTFIIYLVSPFLVGTTSSMMLAHIMDTDI